MTTSRMSRSRARASLKNGVAPRRGFDSGSLGNFRSVSAMILFQARGSLAVDGLAQVALGDRQVLQQELHGGGMNAGERGRHQLLREPIELGEEGARRRREKQALGAPVVRVGAALDQPVVAQP